MAFHEHDYYYVFNSKNNFLDIHHIIWVYSASGHILISLILEIKLFR